MGERTAKEILESTRLVLVKNIVLTEELCKQLVDKNVVTQVTLKDLKECTKRDDQNTKLLDLLVVRGRAVLERLCDAFQLSGFNFLADMLRDELMNASSGHVDTTDLKQRYPRVEKALDKRERAELDRYVQEKVHESHLKESWQKDTSDKEKAMLAKQRQLEDTWQFREILEDKDKTIKQLEENLEKAINDAASRGVHMQHLSDYLSGMKKKHQDDLRIQMKFNEANDNALRRYTQRQQDMDKELTVMVTQINHVLLEGRVPSDRSDEHERIVTVLDKARHSLEKLLTLTKSLQAIKPEYDSLKDAAFYVISQLGRDVKSDLKDAFQGFIVDNEEVITALRNQIENLKTELQCKEKAAREQLENDVNRIRDLELQLEEVNEDVLKKEVKYQTYKTETERLKKVIAGLERQLHAAAAAAKTTNNNRRPSTPRFKDYVDNNSGVDTPINNNKKQPVGGTPDLSSPTMNSPRREVPKHKHGFMLPSIHKVERKPYGLSTSLQGNTGIAATKVYDKPKMGGSAMGDPFTVQSINPALGRSKALGTYQNTYGRQQSVEVQMKKHEPIYR